MAATWTQWRVYGADRPAVLALSAKRPEWNERLHPELPYRVGEVVWSIRCEAARTIEDVLARRTRGLFLDARASIEAAPRVGAILAEELNRERAWQEGQIESFRKVAGGFLPPA